MTKLINRAAAYYFPTTVLLVDDDMEYLDTIENIVDRDAAVYKSFKNPIEVYEYIEKHFKHQHLAKSCIERKVNHNTIEVHVNIKPISQEVFNPKRFEHISVLIADHDMPEMKGLELLKKLKDFPIRKILLTGKATLQETLDAYNTGIIDQYISKDVENFPDHLNEAIKKQCSELFKNYTKPIIDSIVFEREQKIKEQFYLSSYEFMELLDGIVKDNNITEYYLIDQNGSYVLFDIDGNSSWLIIKNNFGQQEPVNKINNFISEDVLQKLKNQPMKIFTFNHQEYHYAYLDKDNFSKDFDKNKIISFYQYQENLAE